jgi:Holliday junction DNA helicase RuvA
MIHSLNGRLTHTESNLAVIECGGVGFACRTTATSLNALEIGAEYTFLTYMSVREDAIELFGFISAHELSCFKMLLSISGVGPKAALSILSEMSPQDFALAVVGDDAKALTRVPGIGAKTAQLIILKLKDKLSKDSSVSAKRGGESPYAGKSPGIGAAPVGSSAAAMSALLVLGFAASEAAQALSELPGDMETSEKIKQALKRLSAK